MILYDLRKPSIEKYKTNTVNSFVPVYYVVGVTREVCQNESPFSYLFDTKGQR